MNLTQIILLVYVTGVIASYILSRGLLKFEHKKYFDVGYGRNYGCQYTYAKVIQNIILSILLSWIKFLFSLYTYLDEVLNIFDEEPPKWL